MMVRAESKLVMGKKHDEGHVNHEAWIIPYADMVTLLFAFFVVMYSISQQDLAKLKDVSESLKESFMGFEEGGDKVKTPATNPGSKSASQVRVVVKRNVTNQEVIDDIQKQLKLEGFEFIYQEDVSPLNIKIDERGVVISMSAGYIFDKNSTEIKPEMLPVVQIISDIIKGSARIVAVEGHTDDRPIVGNLYYSNWELSTLRATSMVRTLVQQFGVDPNRLVASGYSKFRPIADNKTDAGRKQNRRVDIIMLNAETYEELYENKSIPR